MMNKYLFQISRALWMLHLLLFIPGLSFAQFAQEPLTGKDSLSEQRIPQDKIILYSLQSEAQLRNLSRNIIGEEVLLREKAKSDSILARIESLMLSERLYDYDSLLTRELNNKRIMWSGYRSTLEERVGFAENNISKLSAQAAEVNQELLLWNNTMAQLDTTYADSLYRATINIIIAEADSLDHVIVARKSICFTDLKNLKQSYFRVEEVLNSIADINRRRQEQLLQESHPPLLQLDFFNPSQWKLVAALREFRDQNQITVNGFYKAHKLWVYLFALFLFFLIALFTYLKRKSEGIDASTGSFYQKSALIILKRPVSVALILGIFTSGIFLMDRPPILIDLSIVVLAFPILDIVAHVTDKIGSKYLVAFGILILLRFANYIFPPSMPVHRLLLLLIGVLELLIMLALLKKMKKEQIIGGAFHLFLRYIILAHIVAASIGILANFTGHLSLAEIAVDLTITNTLVGLLLIISSLVLIGLLQYALEGKNLLRFNFIRKRKQMLKKRVELLLTSVVSLLWFVYILRILRINDLVYESITNFLNKPLSVGSISFSVGGVLLFFFIIWLSVQVADLIKAILEDEVLSKLTLKKGVPRMISVMTRFSLIAIGVFIAVSAVGMPLDQLTIILSAFSVGIGFGLQNVVSNFVSGIVLLFERPIQIGDTVEVNNLVGNVKSMGIRSSNIRTLDGAEVVVPNANLISNEVVNWTLSDRRRRIEIISGVAYGSNVHQVKDILMKILVEHPDILKDPEPMVLFSELGESSLDFRMLFWTGNYDNWLVVKSEVIFRIYDDLNTAGIQIPFPQRDLHIISDKTKGDRSE